jgi:hypothetical protein
MSTDYNQRTEWNVRDSDATLILNEGALVGGTALTLELAGRLNKPCLVVQLDEQPSDETHQWLEQHGINVLNVAGPRESKCPGIRERVKWFLVRVLSEPTVSVEAET